MARWSGSCASPVSASSGSSVLAKRWMRRLRCQFTKPVMRSEQSSWTDRLGKGPRWMSEIWARFEHGFRRRSRIFRPNRYQAVWLNRGWGLTMNWKNAWSTNGHRKCGPLAILAADAACAWLFRFCARYDARRAGGLFRWRGPRLSRPHTLFAGLASARRRARAERGAPSEACARSCARRAISKIVGRPELFQVYFNTGHQQAAITCCSTAATCRADAAPQLPDREIAESGFFALDAPAGTTARDLPAGSRSWAARTSTDGRSGKDSAPHSAVPAPPRPVGAVEIEHRADRARCRSG